MRLWMGRFFYCLSVIGVLVTGSFSALGAQTYQWNGTEEMRVPRFNHSSTLLQNGWVLVAGGENNDFLKSAELYDPQSGNWTLTGPMSTRRTGHTATLLPSGKVLVTGGQNGGDGAIDSSEIYDPTTGTWAPAGDLLQPRHLHTATLLPSGEVLVVGGDNGAALDSCEVYDPIDDRWNGVDPLTDARSELTATLLDNGDVLVMGGVKNGMRLDSVERYDWVDQEWTSAEDLLAPREGHTATLLSSGQVLIAGGLNDLNHQMVEIYDPEGTGSMAVASLPERREHHSAVLLPSSKVLLVGGVSDNQFPMSSTLYDPDLDIWTETDMQLARQFHSTTLLPSGEVLVAGGDDGEGTDFSSAEIFSEISDQWIATMDVLQDARSLHTATLLPDETVLVTGGCPEPGFSVGCQSTPLASIEIYDPVSKSWAPHPDVLTPERFSHTATRLQNGQVLIAGGWDGAEGTSTIEALLFDVIDGISSAGTTEERRDATATLLSDGRVLLAGGYRGVALDSAEIYTPGEGWHTVASPMAQSRGAHTATLLPTGEVLVVGGFDNDDGSFMSAEIFDPVQEQWRGAGGTSVQILRHTATLLPSGKVLIAGGGGVGDQLRAELYDPFTDEWTRTGDDPTIRLGDHAAVVLPSGHAMLAGGLGETTTVLYHPTTGQWSHAALLNEGRVHHTLTVLASGEVLAVGNGAALALNSSEVYSLGEVDTTRRPEIQTSPVEIGFGTPFQISGLFRSEHEAGDGTDKSSHVNYPVFHLRSTDGFDLHTLEPDLRPDGSTTFWDEPATYTFSQLPAALNAGPHYLTATVAGVSSEPVPVEVTCSENLIQSILIEPDRPLSFDPPEQATFTATTQGVRYFQWFRDGFPISGATEASYTTPSVSPNDDGTEYHLQVWSGCATDESEPILLIIDDGELPSVEVRSPRGGETWPLKTSDTEPTRDISWNMSDNVRICRVDVELLYSIDGGDNYVAAEASSETDPEEDLPRALGQDGYCTFEQRVETTNITYSLPSSFPSGETDSLYKVRVTATDQQGNVAFAESLRPFFIVDPSFEYKTLILKYPMRMQNQMALSDAKIEALDDALRDLASHERVEGFIMDLGDDSLDDLYQRWDEVEEGDFPSETVNLESVTRANQILFGCPPSDLDCLNASGGNGGIHARILEFRDIYRSVQYIILVGDDRIIPMARLRDLATLWPESRYIPEDLTEETAVGKALAFDYFLSDDPLATLESTTPDDLETGVSIPDLSIGRLVEEPHEILKTIQTFLSRNGVLDLTDPDNANKFQTTGYDFLQDSAKSIANIWSYALSTHLGLGLGTVDRLITPPKWTEEALTTHLCGNGGAPYSVINLNGHATHYQEGIPGEDFFDVEGILSGAIGPSSENDPPPNFCGDGELDLRGSVIYAVGCHGGLPVPGNSTDQSSGTDYSLDLPQTFLGRGAVVYIANSGFGWGLTHGVGYSERLLEIFSQALTEIDEDPATPRTVGEAVVEAKIRYSLQQRLDAYDEKTLMQWTVFGLPMYFVQLVDGTEPGSLSPDEPLKNEDLPSEQTLPSGVHVQRNIVQPGDTPNHLNPPYMTVVELGFNFMAEEGVYQKFDAERDEIEPEEPCPNNTVGCYYTLNGNDATGMVDVPIEPLLIYDSRLVGTSLHGTLWLGGTYTEEPQWKPLFGSLVSNGVETIGLEATPRKIRIRPVASQVDQGPKLDVCQVSGNELSRLAFPVGEVVCTDGDCDLGATHRRYSTIRVDNLYFNNTDLDDDTNSNCDRRGPKITSRLLSGLFHQVTGTNVEWVVDAVDLEQGGEVWKVVVVYDTDQGSWEPFELTRFGASDTWRGTVNFQANQRLTYVIQAVDTRGNVSWLEWTADGANNDGLKNQEASGVPPFLADTVDVVVELQDVDLAMGIRTDQAPVTLGTGFNFVIEVGNPGSEPATELRVELELPGSLSVTSISGDDWTCTETPLQCSRSQLNAGNPGDPITLGVTAPNEPGHWTLVAKLTADQIPIAEAIEVSHSVLGLARSNVEVQLTGPDTAHPSEMVHYNLLVKNHGRDTVPNLRLDVDMSPRLENVTIDGQPWDATPLELDLATMQETNIMISGTVSSITPAEILSHSVQAELPDPVLYEDPDPSNNQSASTTQVIPVGDLVVTLVTPPSTMAPGETETFQISVLNRGPHTIEGFDLIVHPSTGLEDITPGPDWTNQSLGSGLTLTRSFTGSVPQGATPGPLTVRVDAVTPADHQEENDTDNTAVHTLTVVPAIDLEVTLFGNLPDTVTPGDPIEVTVTVSNHGPHAVQGLNLSHLAESWLENAQQEGGNWENQTLGAGANFTRTLRGTIGAQEPAGVVDLTFEVDEVPGYSDLPIENNRLDLSLTVEPEVDLGIEFTSAPSPLQPDTPVTFEVKVTNHGPAAVEGFDVQRVDPEWLLHPTEGGPEDLPWTHLPRLEKDDFLILILEGTVAPTTPPGEVSLSVNVPEPEDLSDPLTDNNMATAIATVAPQIEVSFSLFEGPEPLTPGQSECFMVAVTNGGPNLVPDVNVSIQSDQAGFFEDASFPFVFEGGSDPQPQTVCDVLPVDAPSGTALLTAHIIVPDGYVDGMPDNNTLSIERDIVPGVDLEIEIIEATQPLHPREDVSFTLKVTNKGTQPIDGFDIVLDPPSWLENPQQGGGPWTGQSLQASPDFLERTLTGTVAPNIPAGQVDLIVFIADLVGYSDSDPASNTGSIVLDVVPKSDLAITVENDGDVFDAGNRLTYTVTLTNQGLEDMHDLDIQRMLSDVLVDVDPGTEPWSDLTIMAGGTETRTLEATLAEGSQGLFNATFEVEVPDTYDDPNPDNNSATDEDLAETGPPSLSLTLTSEPTSVAWPGGDVDITIEVENTSAISDPVELTSLMEGNRSLDGEGDCDPPVTIAPEGPPYTCTFTVHVTGDVNPPHPVITVTALGIDDEETSTAPASGSVEVPIEQVTVDLEVTKTDHRDTLRPGDPVLYTITLKNLDPHQGVTDITLIDTPPPELVLDSQTALTWSGISLGTEEPDNTMVFYLSGTLAEDAHGVLENSVQIDLPNGIVDSNPNNNTATDSTTIMDESPPSIEVTKVTDPAEVQAPEGDVTFTVTVTNTSAQSDPFMLDTLIDDHQSDVPGQEGCEALPYEISPGGQYTCTYTATLSGEVGEEITSTVTAEGIDDEGDPAQASASALITVIDVLRPELTFVSTVSDTGDGRLDADEVTEATLTQLHLHFSEELDETTAADVDAYRLVGAGVDGVLQTEDCGALQGDDTTYAINDAQALTEATVGLWIHGGVPLPRGLYRLWACSSVTDISGNEIVETSLDFFVAAQHQLRMSNFDDDSTLDNWVLEFDPPDAVVFSPDDVRDAETSGSALLSGGTATVAIRQCVNLVWNNGLEIGGWTQVAATGVDQPSLVVELEIFQEIDCQGSPTPPELPRAIHVGTSDGLWIELPARRIPLPRTIGSVFVTLRAQSEDQTFDLWLDDLYMKLVPLHGDGFESGDTSMWSSTVPEPDGADLHHP